VTEDELLERLRRAVAEADGPPQHVLDAARAARTWADVDGELLDLRADSLVDATATRNGGGARLLRFGTPDRTVELQVSGLGTVDVVGQVEPAGTDAVELTHAGGTAIATVDRLGRFTVSGIPAGPASLAWREADGHRVRTAWVGI
jgi:hypothetical protein